MELRPGTAHAFAAGAAEAGGGVLLAAGAATPLGAAAISGTMITAIRKVHAPKGPWVTEGGYEYNLVLLAVVFALTDAGPGRLSVDALRGRERWGLGWALAQLGAAGASAPRWRSSSAHGRAARSRHARRPRHRPPRPPRSPTGPRAARS